MTDKSQVMYDALLKTKDEADAMLKNAPDAADAVAQNKANAEALYTLGHTAYSVENFAQAEKLFFGMILFNASDLRGWLGYGGACEAQKKWRQALDGYAGAINLAPDDPVAPFRAGTCFMALEMRDNARKAFELAKQAGSKVQDDPLRLPFARKADTMLKMMDEA